MRYAFAAHLTGIPIFVQQYKTAQTRTEFWADGSPPEEATMTCDQFRDLALSFPNTIEFPHFDRAAFKVAGKRIFATMHEASETVNVKFSPVDQSVYAQIDKKAIYPVGNKWGLQGWTTFQLARVDKQTMLDALNTAYTDVLTSKRK
jgi:hypothetical protein